MSSSCSGSEDEYPMRDVLVGGMDLENVYHVACLEERLPSAPLCGREPNSSLRMSGVASRLCAAIPPDFVFSEPQSHGANA